MLSKKVLLKTKGNYCYVDPYSREYVSEFRPSVVTRTDFIMEKIAESSLEVIAPVRDEATDAEFKKYWLETTNNKQEPDEDFAVQAFLSEFGVEKVSVKRPQEVIQALEVTIEKEKPVKKSKKKKSTSKKSKK